MFPFVSPPKPTGNLTIPKNDGTEKIESNVNYVKIGQSNIKSKRRKEEKWRTTKWNKKIKTNGKHLRRACVFFRICHHITVKNKHLSRLRRNKTCVAAPSILMQLRCKAAGEFLSIFFFIYMKNYSQFLSEIWTWFAIMESKHFWKINIIRSTWYEFYKSFSDTVCVCVSSNLQQ